ncbi:MAG: tripartite tricarboxylate transporter TctB family protein [Spirochaetales bacterium]|nr:tripartite tricarboxylate transporter TctB family protein [Spirochaetales bacterium]
MKKYLKNRDFVSGFVLVLLSVIGFYSTNKFNVSSISSYGNPATVPRIILILLFIMSALTMVGAIRKENGDGENREERSLEQKLPEYLTFVLLVVYVFTVKPIGYVISTAIYLLLQMYVLSCFEKRRLWLFALIAIMVSPLLYYIFRAFFDVLLPAGILGWRP